jgi:hypothetical protein
MREVRADPMLEVGEFGVEGGVFRVGESVVEFWELWWGVAQRFEWRVCMEVSGGTGETDNTDAP